MSGWLLVPGLVALAAGYALFDEDAGLRRWLHLRGELDDAHGRIARLHVQIENLEREVGALGEGDFAIERAIREDLLLAKPGETLIRLSRSDASNARIP